MDYCVDQFVPQISRDYQCVDPRKLLVILILTPATGTLRALFCFSTDELYIQLVPKEELFLKKKYICNVIEKYHLCFSSMYLLEHNEA